ncbi:hypothetical protein EST38_g6558 [Candolleomyces aberdarensis]|uniref:Uncharacterized protein n=1 Tax=Candolleomyces aberdarensis TaxID=2316362 RepID=A0A4Q2DHJ6_9AGAR|nr:hypothetical protein EST38_g6558 [Candolleomyces aberdarensis]
MATSPRYEKLDFNPGIVPSRKRRTSGCKCMLFAVGILISLLVSIGIAKFVSSMFYGIREPHSFLYENKTLAEVKNMSTVVRPLVDRDQKFDIIATVWVRTLDPRYDASKQYDWMHGEDHIFSDTVFHGVTLMDEHVHTKVNLSIPLETFSKAETLENFDIRATFKLVPQSPSLFDHITNFTSWVPETVVLPDISPEARARKLKGDLSPPETLEDLQNAALESFAISAPLIDLHPIKSACGRKTEEEEDIGPALGAAALPTSTKGKPPLKVHPHVVTRTDLRVVRMDKIHNKRAYDAHFKQLRQNDAINGCTRAGGDLRDGRKCSRRFLTRANCEARIELEIPDEKTSTSQKQVAYAPFLSVNSHSWGPLDIIPMPVDREHCPEGSVPETPQFMPVTWNLAYSGSTAEKLLLAEVLSAGRRYNTTDTEFNKLQAQQSVENIQRIHGHKHSLENRIGRMLIFDVIAVLLKFLRISLQFHYWHTRSTTVGISIIGSSLTALSFSLLFALDLWNQKAFRDGTPLLSSLFTLVTAVYWYLLTPSVILRAVLRLEERASTRLETKGRKRWIIGILVGVFTLYFIDTLRDLPLISRLGPTPDPVPAELLTPNAIKNYLVNPLLLCGTIFQVILNYTSKTFAGGYKLAVWMHLVSYLISVVAYIPQLAWRAGGIRHPMLLGNAVTMGSIIVFAVQGVLYKRVEQDIEDKDTS